MNPIEIALLQKNQKTDELRACEINRRIRMRYPLSAELAILRQRDTKPEEFAEYCAYAELCKAEADVLYLREEDA